MYDKHRESQLSSEWIRDTVSPILQVSPLDELCAGQVLVRTEDATCSLASDTETIAKQVNGAGGFERLDKEIMEYRIEMLKSMHAAPLAVVSGLKSMNM